MIAFLFTNYCKWEIDEWDEVYTFAPLLILFNPSKRVSLFCTELIIIEAFLSFCLPYSWTRSSRLQLFRKLWTCPCFRAICLWTKTIRNLIALIATGATAVSTDKNYNLMFNDEASRVCFSRLRSVIGWQSPRHLFNQWETKPKTNLDLPARIFPRLTSGICLVFWLVDFVNCVFPDFPEELLVFGSTTVN